METRIKILSMIFGALGILILVRLFFWQVIRSESLSAQAKLQHVQSAEIPARRGTILASDGFPLVESREAFLVWAQPPKLEKSKEEVATLLSQILGEDEKERIYGLLSREGVAWVPIKDRIDKKTREKIEELQIMGIGFDPSEARFYPEGSMAAHLLGFVGKDAAGEDVGYFGLEGFYDLTLSGKSGSSSLEKDAAGNPILFGIFSQIPALNGLTLKTTIDRAVQYIAEKKLSEGLEKYGATEGQVLVMSPKGAILAIASLPTYDPVKYSKVSDKEIFRNPAISQSFEPGSIFKVLVMAAALDSGAVKPDTRCDDCDGPVVVDKYLIKTWNEKYFPNTTAEEIIIHSDNIGMVFVGRKLGQDKLWEYLDGFGIGKLAAIDLQEEANPGLRQKGSWNIVDLATASFGQGVAVTPIQMLRAVAGIANGGILPVPQVVDKIIGEGWKQDVPAKFEKRVVSQKAVYEVTQMMVRAVEEGEAKWAAPRGFSIAGKTGTAQIPVAGHYDEEKTIVSFVGFVPASDPKFVMLVTLREPTSSPWGSETAAPLWFSIAKELFPYFGIQPGS